MINYAHRGASQYYPENTLYAFYAGLHMGADGIETDIQHTLDGVPVLFHDRTLERILGDPRRIADYTYAQLLERDFGAFKGAEFAGERIVKLETFLAHFGGRGLKLALELKSPGVEEAALACVNARGCRDEVTFTSFSWDSLVALRGLDREIAAGFLTERITAEALDRLAAYGIGQICPRAAAVSEADMALARGRGFSVRFWGIRDEADMRRAIALGSDGMTCNFPDKLTRALRDA